MSEINSKKRISKNIISSVLQVFGVGLLYLLLYKYLIKSLGVAELGVWSIILATSSIVNLANFGISSSLVKFIADYNSRKQELIIPKLIFTSFITVFTIFIILLFVFNFFGTFFLKYIIENNYLNLALDILPYSLICLFINALGSVFTSALEGFQKNYIRNYLMLISTIVFLTFCYLLVPVFRLKGVAYAQIIQAVILLLSSFIMIKKNLSYPIFRLHNFDRYLLKDIMNFGIKFQVISISQMLYEPITKGLIGKYGGMATLGYYEMAARLTNQIRALILNSNQVLIPVVAHAANSAEDSVKKIYYKTIKIVFFIDIALIISLLAFASIISILWIGFYENTFVFSIYVLGISTFVNLISGPAYFSAVGEGKLNIILKSQILIGVLNLFLGLILGHYFSGKGVILSWGLSVIISSLYLLINYQKSNKIKYNFLFLEFKTILISLIVLVVSGVILYKKFEIFLSSSLLLILLGFYGVYILYKLKSIYDNFQK